MTAIGLEGPLVQARGLVKCFDGVVAVDHVSFSVDRGTVAALLGPNGAGKTTTLRMLVGLARPDAGTATVCGLAYRQLTAPLRQVGVSLDSAGFHPDRHARDELLIMSDAAGLPRERVAEVLELVELDQRDGRTGGFSTGMRQRLGLAAALLGDPLVLLLDEPASGLDPAGRAWLRHFLEERARAGCALIVSSHVLSEVEQLAHRVLILDRGRLVSDSLMADLLSRSAAEVVVRSPTPQPLAAGLRALGAQVRTEDDVLRVSGLSLDQVGDAAAALHLTVRELRAQPSRLEDVFLALTDREHAPPPPIRARPRAGWRSWGSGGRR